MAQELTGNTVASTYESLIKVGTNSPLGTSLQTLSDGAGTDLPIQVSETQINIIGTLNTTDGTLVVGTPVANTDAATKGYVDTQVGNEETARINADNALAGDITAVETTITSIQGWTLDGLNLSDSIDIQGANGISVTNNGNNIITIDGSGVGGGVSELNGLTGDLTIASDNDNLTVDASGTTITLTSLPKNVVETVYNSTAGTLPKGTPVHVVGAQGQNPSIIAADAASNYPAQFVLNEDIGAGLEGEAIALGFIKDVPVPNASIYTEGDEVWLASGGGFTTTKPTGSNAIQKLGVILKVNTGGNTIGGMIFGTGVEEGLPNLPQGYVWRGGTNDVPTAVDANTLYVAYATTAGSATTSTNASYSDEAADVKVDAITSGTYRVIVGDTGLASGAYQRIKSDVADGLTYNTTGDVLSAGAFSATNNVTAGGALIGASLDISGNADIDGTLTLGAIGDVEGEIDDLNTFVANYNEFSPIVNETASIAIDDGNYSTYKGKTVVITSATAVDVELDFSNAPSIGDEIYVVQGGSGTVTVNQVLPTAIVSSAGTDPSARTQWSGMVLKCIAADTWLVMGDIE